MTDQRMVVKESGEITEVHPATIKLTSQAIAIIAENIDMAQKLVNKVLEDEVDYGTQPGVRGKGLWDPGASKIMAAFNCYARHKVIYHEENDDAIVWTIECELVSRDTKDVVGTGVGSASTREIKFAYRWVKREDAISEGYTEEEINQLRTKTNQWGTTYRIDNPDAGDLSHTLLTMAAKRSENDAVKSLPGVNSALRKLFKTEDEGGRRQQKVTSGYPDYNKFWGETKGMGYSQDQVHQALGVKSMKEYVDSGHTLDEAVKKLAELKQPQSPTGAASGTLQGNSLGSDPGDDDWSILSKSHVDATWLADVRSKLMAAGKWSPTMLQDMINSYHLPGGCATVDEAAARLNADQASDFVVRIKTIMKKAGIPD